MRRLGSVYLVGQLTCHPHQSGSLYCGHGQSHELWTPVIKICQCHPLLLSPDKRQRGLSFAAVEAAFHCHCHVTVLGIYYTSVRSTGCELGRHLYSPGFMDGDSGSQRPLELPKALDTPQYPRLTAEQA